MAAMTSVTNDLLPQKVAVKSIQVLNKHLPVVVSVGILLVIHRVSYLDLIFKNFVCYDEYLNLKLILKYARILV